MDEALLTSHQIAESFGVTVQTVRRWARTGTIPSLRAGKSYRFLWSDVRKWITKSSRPKRISRADGNSIDHDQRRIR